MKENKTLEFLTVICFTLVVWSNMESLLAGGKPINDLIFQSSGTQQQSSGGSGGSGSTQTPQEKKK